MIWPIKNIGIGHISITQRFGENPQIYKKFGMDGHNGIDIGADLKTPVYASHDGSLKFLHDTDGNGNLQGYGMYAEITAPDKKTTYAHLSKFEGKNRQVKEGDLIGIVGSTGFSTGPHLHFGIKLLKNGQVQNYNNGYFGSVDPEPYLMNNEFVKVINIKGAVGLVILADTAENLVFLGKAHGKAITINPDGSIQTDYTIA